MVTEHTLTLELMLGDGETPAEGEYTCDHVTVNGTPADPATGIVYVGPWTAQTVDGTATLTLPDSEALVPDAPYRVTFRSFDGTITRTSKVFLLTGNMNAADIFEDTTSDVIPSDVEQVAEIRDEIEDIYADILATTTITSAHGVVGDRVTDDYAALNTLLTVTIPDFIDDFGPANNFDVAGVPAVEIPTNAEILLPQQIVLDPDKTFELFTKSKSGARIIYTGAQTRTDGVTVVDDKTLIGSGFTVDDEGVDILIRGAGDGGSTLVTWIQSYTDSTHVELAHAPKTAIPSGATYILRFSAFRKGGVRSDTRGVPLVFRNIVFQGGGICVNNGTKPVISDGCDYHETVGPALVALNKDNTVGNPADEGTGSVTLVVRDAMFNFCHGSIWHQAKTAGLSKYENIRTNGSMDIAIVLGSGFHELDHIDFQGMEATAGNTMPSLWISSGIDVGGRSTFNNLRFGSEVFTEGGSSFEPAFANIVIGPLSGPVVSVGHNDEEDEYDVPLTRPEEIRIGGQSWFGGRAGGPTATSAKHAIILNKTCEGLSIQETKFSAYYDVLIKEPWVDADPTTGTARQTITGRNWFDPSNTISDTHRAGIFDHNGADWRPQPIAQRLSTISEWRGRQNIVPRSNVFTNAVWTKSNCSVAQDVVGPDGVTNSATTITKTAVGAARVKQTIATGYTAGEPLTFSVWLKAGTHNTAGLQVMATDISGKVQYLSAVSKPIRLSTRWERFVAVCPWVPSTAGIEVAVIHDIVGGGLTSSNLDSALVGTTILAYGAQLEVGLAATSYMDVPTSTLRAVLPFQGQASAIATLNFPSTAAGSQQELTVTVVGALVGDVVRLGPPAGLEAGVIPSARVSATDTVTIRLSNITGSAIDPASASWTVTTQRGW